MQQSFDMPPVPTSADVDLMLSGPEVKVPSSLRISGPAPLPVKVAPNFGPGTTVHVCTHGACTSMGSMALIADLEELGPTLGVKCQPRGCLGMCGRGPNCLLEGPPEPLDSAPSPSASSTQPPPGGGGGSGGSSLGPSGRGGAGQKLALAVKQPQMPMAGSVVGGRGPPRRSPKGQTLVRNGIRTFSQTLEILRLASNKSNVEGYFNEAAVKRSQFRSDAMRLLSMDLSGPSDYVWGLLQQADATLTAGISLELELAANSQNKDRHRRKELQMLRGRTRGRLTLQAPANEREAAAKLAQADFEAVILQDPNYATASVEAARVCTFVGQTKEAIDFFQRALACQGSGQLLRPEAEGIRKRIAKLEQALAVGSNDISAFSDGSGTWQVRGITGLTWDTCIYHLTVDQPPSEPHPCPEDMWHVEVFHEGQLREYTPTSDAKAWEEGRLDLLVKTYMDGHISKFFGSLRTTEEGLATSQATYTPLEEQRCFVQLSVPKPTLTLPYLIDASAANTVQSPAQVQHLLVLVGGTGASVALQLLEAASHGQNGPFRAAVQATALCCVHSSVDVLLMDEFREVRDRARDRIIVQHCFTSEPPPGEDPWDHVPQRQHYQGRHHHFVSYFTRKEPKAGPLGSVAGEKGPILGRPTAKTLGSLLTPMAKAGMSAETFAKSPNFRAVLCGPPGLNQHFRRLLATLGVPEESIVELSGGSSQRKTRGGSDGADEVPDEEIPSSESDPPAEVVDSASDLDAADQEDQRPAVSISPPMIVLTQASPAPAPAPAAAPSSSLGTFADRVRQVRGEQ